MVWVIDGLQQEESANSVLVSFHKSFHLSTSPTCIQLTPSLLALLLDKAFRLQDTTDRALLLSDDSSKEQQIKKKNPDLILNGWFCW